MQQCEHTNIYVSKCVLRAISSHEERTDVMTVEATMVLMKPVTHAQIMRTNFVDK